MKKLAILGPKGTYSDQAASLLEEGYEILYYPNILKTLSMVDRETLALVPFENTLDGFVMESMDYILKNKLRIVRQVKLDVDFYLVTYEKNLSDVNHLYVQFKAYGQCQDFILQHQLNPVITQSNIESLHLLKAESKRGFAAIVPSHVDTQEFSLVIKNILGNVRDETRFVLVQQQMEIMDAEEYHCSLVISPYSDEPGKLFSILKVFNDYQINLNSILSRPRKDKMGNYIFYLEFFISKGNIEVINEIKNRIEQQESCHLEVLGLYNKVK